MAAEVQEQAPDYGRLAIVQALPCWRFSPEGGEDLLQRMIGATIVRIGGTDDNCPLEGGGFLIDYIPTGEIKIQRVVFAFNELGLWVEWEG